MVIDIENNIEQYNPSEKRLRVIMEQLLPGIVHDIKEYTDEGFRVEYVDKLSKTAHELVPEQDIYTFDDVDLKFNNTYRDINTILNGKK